jgi:CheY-like chemotaxis protein
VELTLEQLEGKGKEGEVWIAVEVTDSGKGISEENMERIFGKFEQENTSTRRVHGGSGLGLAISKQLIELQGGNISCRSELGKGTTFRVELPFRFEGRVSDDVGATDWSKVNLVGMRLLVVEDLEVNRMLLRQMLRNKGIVMFEAENGKESLEVLKEHEVDLILMDLHMPEMDGIEATKRIRDGRIKGVDSQIPIVCLTADVFKETKEAIFSAGMNDFVTKPIEMRRLFQVLSHWRNQIDARNAELT